METRRLSDFYVPDAVEPEAAKSRVTHLAVGAHQDDLEIFAYHGIAACYEEDQLWFGGITVTDGGGSARSGPYRDFTDDQMKAVRREEQRSAAKLGKYAFVSQLGFSSAEVKDAARSADLVFELEGLFRETKPEILYLHNPADKHDTHIAVLQRSVEALRRLPAELRPKQVYGCEVWRDLDWLDDAAKVMLPVDRKPELAEKLIRVFDSQIAGGKDYALAALGRRKANATFHDSHSVDQATDYVVAMDLSPLFADDSLTLEALALRHLDCFRQDVQRRIQKFDNSD